MAAIIDIANAVVSTLNAATLSEKFTAERAYVPIHELPELATLQISVVPAEIDTEMLVRSGAALYTYMVDIGIQKSIGQGSMSEADIDEASDPLMTLAEEIVTLFLGKPLPGYTKAQCLIAKNMPIYSPEHLDAMRVFTSVIRLSFRLAR